MFNSYCARQLFVSLMRAKVLYLLHRLNVTAGKHRPLSGCLGILSLSPPSPFSLSLSLPRLLHVASGYPLRNSLLASPPPGGGVHMHHAVRIAQSQGRLVGEPTRATIPRRGRGITSPLYSIPAPYILFSSLLFFFRFSSPERFFVYDTRVKTLHAYRRRRS